MIIFKKPYSFAIGISIILIISFTYTLLDAFVFPKSYAIINNEKSSGKSSETNTEATITETSYSDDNIKITIEKVTENNIVFYVADIEISDVSYLKTAFAKDTYGKNITEATSKIAENNNAIFAINGDYYGFRDNGIVIRNGILYRDIDRDSPDNEALIIDSNGDLGIVKEDEVTGEELIKQGVIHCFSFGPTLVVDGKAVSRQTTVSKKANPRTAIGQIDELHYIFIVVDGRTSESSGMTLDELAEEFVERGCTIAYNLDGGGTSTMWFNGTVINSPTDGRKSGERNISDIIYIGR